MKQNKVMLYKAFCSSSTLMDKIIGVFTFSRYSHVEILTSDGRYALRISHRLNGVKLIKNPHYKKDNWDMISVECDDSVDVDIQIVGTMNEDKEYDTFGAIFSAIRLVDWFCDNRKLFCSEAIHEILFEKKNSCMYNPGSLYRKIKGSQHYAT